MEFSEEQEIIHKHAGLRIKERRKALRITQKRLAGILKISYQQIQKYESGVNQISLGRLLQFSRVLNIPPEHFYKDIPLNMIIGQQPNNDLIDRDRKRPFRILLVEDNLSDAVLFSKIMENFEKKVTIQYLSDAETVSNYFKDPSNKNNKGLPDIAIFDLNLPKINGLQLLKEIKSNSQTAIVPIIILTNSVSKKDMVEAYRLGASGFIQKSTDFEEYKEAMITVVHYWFKTVTLPI